MGCFLSKKTSLGSGSTPTLATKPNLTSAKVEPHPKIRHDPSVVQTNVASKEILVQEPEQEEEEDVTKKQEFLVKHRKSHENAYGNSHPDMTNLSSTPLEAIRDTDPKFPRNASVVQDEAKGEKKKAQVRELKEEAQEAVIKKRYCGSKRSYDFDNCVNTNERDGEIDDEAVEEKRLHPQTRSISRGRRRTPSRERDHSKERVGSSGRRVSRSPGRRSGTTPFSVQTSANTNASSSFLDANSRPRKIVSFPAKDKSNDGVSGGNGVETATANNRRRIAVKRTVEPGSSCASSPRSKSPAKANAKANQHPSPLVSDNSSRKRNQSPYRRNPLSKIDMNTPQPQGPSSKTKRVSTRNRDDDHSTILEVPSHNLNQKLNDMMRKNTALVQGNKQELSNKEALENKAGNLSSNVKSQPIVDREVRDESLSSQTLSRSKSSMRSQYMDLSPETLLKPASSYTTLLLEDIQNFHQKSNGSFSLPPCVTKACSILEAVANLNSTTKTTFPYSSSVEKILPNENKRTDNKDSFVETEVFVNDDLMEPTLHKYVNMRRGGLMEDQESSGSNSIVGGGQSQHWGLSSSSWEPNSSDSINCKSSKSFCTREDWSPVGSKAT